MAILLRSKIRTRRGHAGLDIITTNGDAIIGFELTREGQVTYPELIELCGMEEAHKALEIAWAKRLQVIDTTTVESSTAL